MTTPETPLLSRPAEGRLNEFIQGQAPADGILPLIHITTCYDFDRITRGNSLSPQHCDVFNEELTYLFYGRPAYRAKDGNNARLEFEWPIIFLLDPEKISPIKRVFPFDSGAFKLGYYRDFFHVQSKISDFVLEPTIDSVRKIVGAFYVSHAEYYSGSTRKNVELPLRQFEMQGVYELSRIPGVQGGHPGKPTRDERSSAIEVQVADPINLKEALIAIILPEPYIGDPVTQDALARWGVTEIHAYTTLHNMGGEAWVGQVYEKTRELFKRLGYLT
jgi:hypothetical protein